MFTRQGLASFTRRFGASAAALAALAAAPAALAQPADWPKGPITQRISFSRAAARARWPPHP